MVKNSNKNTNTNINSDDDKVNNNINIKIDLGNLAKQTKPRRKSKPKPKPTDDMKTGATINTASSLAPVKFGGPKIPSTDTGFNPNSSYNMLLLQALQNAFKNRQITPQPALPAPTSQPQLTITGPLQQTITGPPQNLALTAPPTQQALTASPSPVPSYSQFYSTSQMANLGPNPNIQMIPTTLQSMIPTTSTPSGFTTVPSTPLNTQQIFNPMAQAVSTGFFPTTTTSSPTISGMVPPSSSELQPMNLTTALAEITPPEVGEWNKDLLELYDREKGKRTYNSIKKNPDMVQYADDVAKFLLKTNPDLEGKIKKAIANPTSKSTTEPDGYRLYLPYLNSIIEKEASNLPYFKDASRTKSVSELKKMFYKRLVNQIYTPEEITIIEGTEAEIPEETPEIPEEPAPVLAPTTLSTFPPSISSPVVAPSTPPSSPPALALAGSPKSSGRNKK